MFIEYSQRRNSPLTEKNNPPSKVIVVVTGDRQGKISPVKKRKNEKGSTNALFPLSVVFQGQITLPKGR